MRTSLALAALVALVALLSACGDGERAERTEQADRSEPASADRDPSDGPEPPAEATPTGETRLRTVYVPAYSHLPRGPNPERRSLLSILLSVRNVDTSATITLNHVDYYDTYGHRVRRYLDEPRRLRPLETAEFTVDTFDETGGSGANFLVYWEGPSDAHSLLTEAVMVGHLGAGYASFTSRGVELDRRPDPATLDGSAEPAPAEPAADEPNGEAAEASPPAP